MTTDPATRSQRPRTAIDFFGMYLAHDAFLRDLQRLSRAVADRRTADPSVRIGWETFRRQLDQHHTTEDDVLWPQVAAATTDASDLAILADMQTEHACMWDLLQRVESELATGGTALGADVAALTSALSSHLTHEEQQALPLIDRTIGTKGWEAFGDEMRKRNGIAAATEYLPWALDGADADDRRKMLGMMPAPIRGVYYLILRPRYRRGRSYWSQAAGGRDR